MEAGNYCLGGGDHFIAIVARGVHLVINVTVIICLDSAAFSVNFVLVMILTLHSKFIPVAVPFQ